jgi:hypothetical protein
MPADPAQALEPWTGAGSREIRLMNAHAYFPCYSNGLKEVAAWGAGVRTSCMTAARRGMVRFS